MKLKKYYTNPQELLKVKIEQLNNQELDVYLKRIILAEYRSHPSVRRTPKYFHYQLRIRRLKTAKRYISAIGEIPPTVLRQTLPYLNWPGLVALLGLKPI